MVMYVVSFLLLLCVGNSYGAHSRHSINCSRNWVEEVSEEVSQARMKQDAARFKEIFAAVERCFPGNNWKSDAVETSTSLSDLKFLVEQVGVNVHTRDRLGNLVLEQILYNDIINNIPKKEHIAMVQYVVDKGVTISPDLLKATYIRGSKELAEVLVNPVFAALAPIAVDVKKELKSQYSAHCWHSWPFRYWNKPRCEEIQEKIDLLHAGPQKRSDGY
jgi:hypothetical protein